MIFTDLEVMVEFARRRSRRGEYDGKPTALNKALIDVCRHRYRVDPERVAVLIFTRDTGHHTSGWWKNPDYERCHHLSLSYRSRHGAPLEQDRGASERIARAFYREDARLVWIEGPYSPEGKSRDVWHYRLFCDPSWSPILPKGEVYSRDWTPADWRSFSEVHGFTPTPDQAPFLLAGGDRP